MAGFEIEGLKEALKKMDELTKNVAKKHVKKALRAAAKPVLQSAKDNAKKIDDPKTSADISKNLVIRTGKTGDKNTTKVRVGVKGGGQFWRSNENVQRKGKPRESNPHYTPVENDTKHFWLVEFGTSKNKAQPFMRPALESNIQNATDAFAEKLKADLMGDIK
ncbi:HK97 gp10 family phage protein [Acinetobacter sp. CWB-G5]|uniref:HK97-gp10 family putative phage morphogenesis protein n=1 Tax=Acinetobacter sp. CWB-G5 TaxID=2855444 RepID=UPI001C47D6E6|nr:HK97-gp10 family putative phage morphogenesis protein [Acinetobacter sp. CWB-G5]MBV7307316.1 HK97 gp10 family phage protein [Acinetobacter sp. CWB-G5]